MHKFRSIYIFQFILAVFFVSIFWVIFPGTLSACDSQKIKLKQEKKEGVHNLYATACFAASRENIWQAILDYDSHTEFMPNTKYSKIIFRKKNYYYVKKKIEILWKEIDLFLHVNFDPQSYIIKWTQNEGLFKKNDGYWRLQEINDKQTQVFYHITIEPKFYIPEWVLKSLSSKNLNKLFQSVEKRAQLLGRSN